MYWPLSKLQNFTVERIQESKKTSSKTPSLRNMKVPQILCNYSCYHRGPVNWFYVKPGLFKPKNPLWPTWSQWSHSSSSSNTCRWLVSWSHVIFSSVWCSLSRPYEKPNVGNKRWMQRIGEMFFFLQDFLKTYAKINRQVHTEVACIHWNSLRHSVKIKDLDFLHCQWLAIGNFIPLKGNTMTFMMYIQLVKKMLGCSGAKWRFRGILP